MVMTGTVVVIHWYAPCEWTSAVGRLPVVQIEEFDSGMSYNFDEKFDCCTWKGMISYVKRRDYTLQVLQDLC